MHAFEILAEPIRRRIIEVLASGEHSAGDVSDVIENEFGVSRSAVSHHLRILRGDGWVTVRADWSNRMYALDEDALGLLELEVHTLRELWLRRTGTVHRNDPHPWHAKPPSKPSRRGYRGVPPDDPWITGVKRQS